jgi:hypothetical protein
VEKDEQEVEDETGEQSTQQQQDGPERKAELLKKVLLENERVKREKRHLEREIENLEVLHEDQAHDISKYQDELVEVKKQNRDIRKQKAPQPPQGDEDWKGRCLTAEANEKTLRQQFAKLQWQNEAAEEALKAADERSSHYDRRMESVSTELRECGRAKMQLEEALRKRNHECARLSLDMDKSLAWMDQARQEQTLRDDDQTRHIDRVLMGQLADRRWNVRPPSLPLSVSPSSAQYQTLQNWAELLNSPAESSSVADGPGPTSEKSAARHPRPRQMTTGSMTSSSSSTPQAAPATARVRATLPSLPGYQLPAQKWAELRRSKRAASLFTRRRYPPLRTGFRPGGFVARGPLEPYLDQSALWVRRREPDEEEDVHLPGQDVYQPWYDDQAHLDDRSHMRAYWLAQAARMAASANNTPASMRARAMRRALKPVQIPIPGGLGTATTPSTCWNAYQTPSGRGGSPLSSSLRIFNSPLTRTTRSPSTIQEVSESGSPEKPGSPADISARNGLESVESKASSRHRRLSSEAVADHHRLEDGTVIPVERPEPARAEPRATFEDGWNGADSPAAQETRPDGKDGVGSRKPTHGSMESIEHAPTGTSSALESPQSPGLRKRSPVSPGVVSAPGTWPTSAEEAGAVERAIPPRSDFTFRHPLPVASGPTSHSDGQFDPQSAGGAARSSTHKDPEDLESSDGHDRPRWRAQSLAETQRSDAGHTVRRPLSEGSRRSDRLFSGHKASSSTAARGVRWHGLVDKVDEDDDGREESAHPPPRTPGGDGSAWSREGGGLDEGVRMAETGGTNDPTSLCYESVSLPVPSPRKRSTPRRTHARRFVTVLLAYLAVMGVVMYVGPLTALQGRSIWVSSSLPAKSSPVGEVPIFPAFNTTSTVPPHVPPVPLPLPSPLPLADPRKATPNVPPSDCPRLGPAELAALRREICFDGPNDERDDSPKQTSRSSRSTSASDKNGDQPPLRGDLAPRGDGFGTGFAGPAYWGFSPGIQRRLDILRYDVVAWATRGCDARGCR